jgi:hypothetical protein
MESHKIGDEANDEVELESANDLAEKVGVTGDG